jgi:hypothetical protein
MPSGITGHDGKVVGENVDDFAFALVAPLGADDDGGLATFHWECTLLARNLFRRSR